MFLSQNLGLPGQAWGSLPGSLSDFSPVLLQAGPTGPGAGGPLGMLFPVAAIMLIFYLLIIRPQHKRQKEHEATLKSIAKGDKVVTAGGIHGEVIGDTEEILTIEIANIKGERIRVKVDRSRIDRRSEKAEGNNE